MCAPTAPGSVGVSLQFARGAVRGGNPRSMAVLRSRWRAGAPRVKPGAMSQLTEAQIAEFRDELVRQLAKLEASMIVTDEAMKPVQLDQTAVGRLSRMDSLQSQSMAKGLRERETVRLALIQEALGRVAAGTYGVCTTCGAGIAAERLFVFPESGTCVGCGG